MLTQTHICRLCGKPLDLNGPTAIVKWEYTHLSCADEYDARDVGPSRTRAHPSWQESYSDAVGISYWKEL